MNNFFDRMSRKTAVLIIIFAVLMMSNIPINAGDINKNAGTTGFSFLKQGVGARAVSLGGAFVSIAGDPSIIYYNPAGTAHLDGRQFLAGYHNYVLDVQSGFVAATMPFKTYGNIGLFISYMNFGEFIRTDVNGVVDNADPTFSGGDFLIGANYSRFIGSFLSAGINAKFISESADGYSSQAIAVDFGLMLTNFFGDSLTNAGVSVYNFGGVLSGFSAASDYSHKDKLPTGVRAGVSHSLRELPVIVSLNGVYPNDNDLYISAGLEFYKLEPLYLRLGYSTFGQNYKTGSDRDGLGGFAFGFGLDYKQLQISYAFMPYLDLGSSHRVTFTGGF
ncbi:MAG: PorV/PorQ family protein [candidate division Zixibacteria bacterium]